MKIDPIRLVHITTVPQSLSFLSGHVGYMKAKDIEVLAVSSPGKNLAAFGDQEGIAVHAVEMPRRITPLDDLVALWRLFRLLRRIQPDLVHAHTPKGGLLGIVAAWLARVPVRIYHIHGLPYVTAKGPRRWLLQWAERTSCTLSHRVLCVSHSIRAVVVAEGICPSQEIEVLLAGSINGVDSQGRFNPATKCEKMRWHLRQSFGIPRDSLVVGYVGRIVRDKGFVELIEAWRTLREEFPLLHMLIVGPFEPQDPVPSNVECILRGTERIHLAGQIEDPSALYAIMDIVVLPSYREGLPLVPLEAAAMALPVVATRIPGCVDAVVDGQTGTLVPPRDAWALAQAIHRYLEDPALRRRHGLAGRSASYETSAKRSCGKHCIKSTPVSCAKKAFSSRKDSLQGAVSTDTVDSCRPNLTIGVSPIMTRAIKRLIDLVTASIALILLAPVIALMCGAIRLMMGRPVFFRQVRPGYRAKPFTLYKFRTMRETYNNDGTMKHDAERLTPLGRFLRKTSLDELPQLWNVLRGDLSLVGPRPLLVEYLARYTPDQARRHEVRPGITGLAQVSGRNAISWEDKFSYDVWYVDHWSLWLDLKILILTLIKVTRQTGISQAGHATMQEFTGTMGRP